MDFIFLCLLVNWEVGSIGGGGCTCIHCNFTFLSSCLSSSSTNRPKLICGLLVLIPFLSFCSVYTSPIICGRFPRPLPAMLSTQWMVSFKASLITSTRFFSLCTRWLTWASTSLSTSGLSLFMMGTIAFLMRWSRLSMDLPTTPITTYTSTTTTDSISLSGTKLGARTRILLHTKGKGHLIVWKNRKKANWTAWEKIQ